MRRPHPLNLFIFVSAILWLNLSLAVGLCRHSVNSSTVEFENETAVALLIPSKPIKSKLQNWLATEPHLQFSLTGEKVQMGLQTLLRNHNFLRELSKRFQLDQADASLKLKSVDYSILSVGPDGLPGKLELQPADGKLLPIQVELRLELGHVSVKMERPTFTIFGFNIPLFFLKRVQLPSPKTVVLEEKLQIQFSSLGEIQSIHSQNPDVTNFIQLQWDQQIFPFFSKSPLKLTMLDINSNGDSTVGVGLKKAKGVPPKTCVITCEPFDFAVALNSSSLPQIIKEVTLMPEFRKKLSTTMPGIRLLGEPQVRFTKSSSANSLSFETDFKVQPLEGHPLRRLVKSDFVIHLQLQFHLTFDPNGQVIRVRMGQLQPHSIQFFEREFKVALRILAAVTPNFVKQTLHRQILAMVEAQVQFYTRPIYFKNLQIPGLPEQMPKLRLIAIGSDPQHDHPYVAFKIEDEILNK